jgi:hypothetical protein
MPALIVTTSREPNDAHQAEASRWAGLLEAQVVDRADLSLARLAAAHGAPGVLVVGGDRVTYYEPARDLLYFFHPGMARRRIRNLKARETGNRDPMITALGIGPGDSVLDCTLGRGTDATVAAFVVGTEGRVVGIEKVPVLAWLTVEGLRHYEIEDADTRAAMRRVEAYCADYAEFLPLQGDGSYDAVYFDPIFEQMVAGASAMIPLRQLASHEPLTSEALAQARRVARRRVVIKQPAGSPLWERLGIDVEIVTGGKSHVEYGVMQSGG